MISLLDIDLDGQVTLSDAQLFQQWASDNIVVAETLLTEDQRQKIDNISSFIDFGLGDNELHAQVIYDLVFAGSSDSENLESLLHPTPVILSGDNLSYFDVSLPMIEMAIVIRDNIHYLCPVNPSFGMQLNQKENYSYDQSEILIPFDIQNGDHIIVDYKVWRVNKVQKCLYYWKASCKDIKGIVY